ncbi:MAG TPA: Maf family protein [Bellilinea sp.]
MPRPMFLLGSNSPRRQQMISWTGWTFTVQPADLDESRLPGESPAEYVTRLAVAKARVVAEQNETTQLILAADTIVVDGDFLLGKPSSAAEAVTMLRQLRWRTHQVYTAIALLDPVTQMLETDLCVSQVPMREYSDAEITAYVATGDPLDKAGAYAIQHAEFHPVENFSGCYASVMGLPLCHLVRTARYFGVEPLKDVPAECQSNLTYNCPISDAVLRGEQVG